MANIDLTKYGITGTTEIVHNPSYEVLFEEETKASNEGYEVGQNTVGVSRGFLLQEWHKAQEGKTTGNCRMQCSGCGSATYGGGVCFEAKN